MEHTTPASLAAAFTTDPMRAGAQLFAVKDPTLVEDLRRMLRAAGLQEAEGLVSGHKSGPWWQTFLQLLADMDPDLLPVLGGQDMTPAGIGALAEDVINAGRATAKQQGSLAWVTEHRLWHWWRILPGMDEAAHAMEHLTRLGDPYPILRSAGLQDSTGHWHHLVVDPTSSVTWTTSTPPLEGRVLLEPTTVAGYWKESTPILTAWRALFAAAPTQTTTALIQHLQNNAPELTHQTWWTTITQTDPQGNTPPLHLLIAATLTGLAHTAEQAHTPALDALTTDQARTPALDALTTDQARTTREEAKEQAQEERRHAQEARRIEARQESEERHGSKGGTTWEGTGPNGTSGSGTWHESDPGTGGPVSPGSETWRESEPRPGGGSGFQRALFPTLAGSYTVVRPLPAGGESDVLLVSDTSGALWVVKQYRQSGWAADERVMGTLRAARASHTLTTWRTDPTGRHLVWLQDWGTDPETGLFYEIQEYLPGGSLEDDTNWDAPALVGPLIDAVSTFHDVVGAHRDIKPGNVLVRSWVGPVLVLADVGLARTVGATSKRFSRRDGTPAYQSPEASQGQVSRAGDWWAVGILIAHTALGHHPLALPDGRLPSDQVILTHLAQRDIDLTGITNPRLRLLCQGLLTRDADKRWGLDQIRAWQAGQSPATGYGTTGPTTTAGGYTVRVRSVRFRGVEHTTPASLAAAFTTDPMRAGNQLFAEKDPTLVEDLRRMLRAAGLREADGLVWGHKSGSWEQTFLQLLADMDPDLVPVLGGQVMTPSGIGALAQNIINAGTATPEQQRSLAWVTEHRLWHWWRTLPGMDDAARAMEHLTLGDPYPILRSAGLQDSTGRWQHLVVDPTGQVSWTTSPPPPLDGRVLLEPTTVAGYWKESTPILTAWRALLAIAPDETTTALHTNLQNVAPEITHQTWWTDLTLPRTLQHLIIAATLTGLAHTAEQAHTLALTALTNDRARTAREEAEKRAQEEHRRVQEEQRRVQEEHRRVQEQRRKEAHQDWEKRQKELRELTAAEKPDSWLTIVFLYPIAFGIEWVKVTVPMLILVGPFLAAAIDGLTERSDTFAVTTSVGLICGVGAVVVVLLLLVGSFKSRQDRAQEAERRRVLEAPPRYKDPNYHWDNHARDWIPNRPSGDWVPGRDSAALASLAEQRQRLESGRKAIPQHRRHR